MREPFRKVVEDATGRKVTGFLSQVSADPPMSLEFFLLAPNGEGDKQAAA